MRRAALLALVIVASGCTESIRERQVEVIPPGAPIKYDRDLASSCVELSPTERLAWRALQGAAIGVGFGAGIGAIAGGSAATNSLPAIWQGAAAGAGAGAAVGLGEGYQDLKNPPEDCSKEQNTSGITPTK